MVNNDIHIEEFILRVPGYSEEEGRNLGQEVAQRVSDGLPVLQEDKKIGALDLRVSIPTGTSRAGTVSMIAEAILKGLV